MNINGLHIGLVINNNDPERRGRVQVFIPYLTNTLYEGWNKENKNISFRTLDPNIFNEEIHKRLIDVLPWSNVIMPCFGGGTGAPVAQGDAPSPNPVPTYVTTSGTDSGGSKGLPESVSVNPGDLSGFANTGLNSRNPTPSLKSSESSVKGPDGIKFSGVTQESYDKLKNEPKSFLEELGRRFPNVYTVTSGYRTQAGNDRISGSARNSKHLSGYALDFRESNISNDQIIALAALAEEFGATAIKHTPTIGNQIAHIHIEWDPTKKGNGLSLMTLKNTNTDYRGALSEYFSSKKTPNNNIVDDGEGTPKEEPPQGGLVLKKSDHDFVNAIPPGMGDGAALGMFSTPNVGAKVYVAFLNNNHMCPIVLGVFQEPSNVLASGITRETEAEEEYEQKPQKPNFKLLPSGVEGSPLEDPVEGSPLEDPLPTDPNAATGESLF
jgi:hypothetical protein